MSKRTKICGHWMVYCGLLLAWLNAGPVTNAISQTEGENRSPEEVVESFHAFIIETMKMGEQASFVQRYEKLEPVIQKLFDMPLVTRLVLASQWNALNAEQQKQFKELFHRYTISQYASRFTSYNDQKFEVTSVVEQRPGIQVVRAKFISNDGDSRRFDYQLRQSKGRWMIVNIAVDGVSDLAIKRSQYVDVIEQDGFDALVKKLEERIEKMKKGEVEDE